MIVLNIQPEGIYIGSEPEQWHYMVRLQANVEDALQKTAFLLDSLEQEGWMVERAEGTMFYLNQSTDSPENINVATGQQSHEQP